MSIQFNKLKIFRKQNNFTQEEIAEKLGVSRQAIAKWERGETQPDVESCVKLADLYGVTLDMLLRDLNGQLEEGGRHIFGLSKINDKGQITLPVKCREVFQLKAGDNILVLGDEEKGGIALLNLGSGPDIVM